MKPRVTLALTLTAALLGTGYWYWEIKTKPARDEAKEDAKRVFPGKQSEASGEVLLRATGKPEVLLRKVGDAWTLITPVVAPVDTEAMKALFEQLDTVKKDEVVDEKASDFRKYGLDEPSGAVTFKPLSGKAQVLFFGADSFDGSKVYGMVDGQPQVFLADIAAKTALLKDADGLRDKRLLDFSTDLVERIQSTAKGGFALELDKGGYWQVRAGSQVEPADAMRVKAWVDALKEIKGESVAEEKFKNGAKYGFGSPGVTISLKGKAPVALIRGRLKDKGPAFYAQVKGQTQAWVLPATAAEALDKEGRALMDLRAFDLQPGMVERFTVWQNGTTITAKRTDLKWAWEAPYVPKSGETFNFEDFLGLVSGTERLKRLPESARPAKPQMVVRFFGAADALLEEAVVGGKQGAGQVAQSAMKHFVMIVPSNVFEGLPKPDKS